MSTYESRLQQRKAQFIDRARQRLALTKTNLELLAEQPERREVLQQITKEFHQLAAAAGIYEIAELCRIAVETEDMLIAAQKDGAAPGRREILSAIAATGAMEEVLRDICAQNADRR